MALSTARADRPRPGPPLPASDPLISVIIPAYQAAGPLGRALGSALDQAYPRLEIVVVDDGSTDATAQVASQAAARDPRIHYSWQLNQGQASARNRAVAQAQGDYLAFLDADDEWLPGKLRLQADLLRHYASLDFIFSESLDQVDARGRTELILSGRYARALRRLDRQPLPWPADVFAVSAASLRPVVFNFGFIHLSSVMLRRDLFERLGGFNPRYRGLEDVDLWVRATRQARFACCAKPLAIHHVGEGNNSRASEKRYRLMIQHLQCVLGSPDYADLQTAARRNLLVRFRWLVFWHGRHGQPRRAWAAFQESRGAGLDGWSVLCALGAWLGPLPFRIGGRLLWP